MAIRIDERISLADDEVSEQFVRSPGPGGQNVNKLATAVQLRFDARGSRSLPDDVRERLLELAGARATKHGEILINAHRFRTRERNREDALERLVSLVRRAAVAGQAAKAHAAERGVEKAPARGQAPALAAQARAPAPRSRHRGMNRRCSDERYSRHRRSPAALRGQPHAALEPVDTGLAGGPPGGPDIPRRVLDRRPRVLRARSSTTTSRTCTPDRCCGPCRPPARPSSCSCSRTWSASCWQWPG